MLVRKFMILKALSTCLAASPAYALASHAVQPPQPVAAALAKPEQMRNIQLGA